MPRRSLHRAVSSLTLVVLVALPLAACGDDATTDSRDFCDSGMEQLSEVEATGAYADEPEEFADAVTELHDGFESIEAPAAIATDWATLSQLFADLDDTLQSIDLSDSDAFSAALSDYSDRADTDEITTASDNISNYFTENCGD
ncbi:MAG TPA: hypothetical protein VGC67_14495 [Cellulomonas sp.]